MDDADPVQPGVGGEQVHHAPVGQPPRQQPSGALQPLVQVQGVVEPRREVGQQGEPVHRGHGVAGTGGSGSTLRRGRGRAAAGLPERRFADTAGGPGHVEGRRRPRDELRDEDGAAVGRLLRLDEEPDGDQPAVAVERRQRHGTPDDAGAAGEQQRGERRRVPLAQVLGDEGDEPASDQVARLPAQQVGRRPVGRDDPVALVGGDGRHPAGPHLADVPRHELGRADLRLARDHGPGGGRVPGELSGDLVEEPVLEGTAAGQGRQGEQPLLPGPLLGQVEHAAQGAHRGSRVGRQRQGEAAQAGLGARLLQRGRHPGADHVVDVVGRREVLRRHPEGVSRGRGEGQLAQHRVPVLPARRLQGGRHVDERHRPVGGPRRYGGLPPGRRRRRTGVPQLEPHRLARVAAVRPVPGGQPLHHRQPLSGTGVRGAAPRHQRAARPPVADPYPQPAVQAYQAHLDLGARVQHRVGDQLAHQQLGRAHQVRGGTVQCGAHEPAGRRRTRRPVGKTP